MKTKFYLFVIFCLSVFVVRGQKNVPPYMVDNISVTPPAFTGIVNSAKPTPNGKDANLIEHIRKNFELPEDAGKSFAQGTEVIKFVVTADGKLTDFRIVNSVYPSVDNEIIRALKTTSGMWKPGYQNDVPVDMEKEIAMMIVAKTTKLNNPDLYFTELGKENFIKGNELFLVKNNAKKALKYYDNCVKYLPYETASLLVRGLCKYKLGDKEGALTDWERVNATGRYDLSELVGNLQNQKGYAEMIKTVDQYITMN
jgi:tetratricopeptide (TPR) repeat protein